MGDDVYFAIIYFMIGFALGVAVEKLKINNK